MNRKTEKGVALVLALVLLLIISVMAVSLMFLSQTETWASLNYKLMSQARDGAEAGINAAANYIINTYTPPASAGTDVLTSYNYNVSPVQSPATSPSGNDVILATSNSGQSSNYPVSSVVTGFGGVAQGSLTAGAATVNYSTYARLLNMEQVMPWGTSTPATVQIWQITSDGSISGIRAADEEVSAILEKQTTPVFTYAAFATSQGCNALNFGGGGTTDTYNSTAALGSGGTPVISDTGGNVGTNGNLAESGNPTTIYGTLSTPRTGVGTCTSGDVTGWTDSAGHITCGASSSGKDCIVELPQTVTYPTPAAPNPVPPTGMEILDNSPSNCATMTGCKYGTGPAPTGNGCLSGDFCLAGGTCPPSASGPGLYPDLVVKGTVHLSAGCYNINSLVENGGGTIIVDSGPAVLNVAGTGVSNPINLAGGGVINNAGWNPALLQIMYAGTGTVNVKGGANATGLIYAPNSTFSFNSAGANWYGAVITGTLADMGGININYDINLKKQAVTVGNWMLDSFTWKKN